MLKKFLDLLKVSQNDADQRAQMGLSKLKGRKETAIGSHRVQIDRKIAEGGYADIYKAVDCKPTNSSTQGPKIYALKRMFIESESAPYIANDLNVLDEGPVARNDTSRFVRRAYEREVSVL